jgi:hypothetical protein
VAERATRSESRRWEAWAVKSEAGYGRSASRNRSYENKFITFQMMSELDGI